MYNQMQAQELRVGNIVYGNDKPARVDRICNEHNDKSIVAWHLDQRWMGASDDALSPIPLTEEWLRRFGFKSIHYSMCLPAYTNGKIEIANDFSISYNGGHRVICKYVHQLQNLVFALTGNDLILQKENE